MTKKRVTSCSIDTPCRPAIGDTVDQGFGCGGTSLALIATIGDKRYEFPIASLDLADIRAAAIYNSFPGTTQMELVREGRLIQYVERGDALK